MSADPAELEGVLHYAFQNRSLLLRALTHKSWAYENGASGAVDEHNEQLEFLGDSVLGMFAAEALVEAFPDLPEGRLSKARARFVNADHLHEVALGLDLGRFLRLGRGEDRNGGRSKRALLADSLEAVIAAVYLDGGQEAAREFVRRHILNNLASFSPENIANDDLKGTLQEYVQSRGLPPPRYRVVSAIGPEHAKTFTVEVRVGDSWSAVAAGVSKKTAGLSAAGALLEKLKGAEEPAPPS